MLTMAVRTMWNQGESSSEWTLSPLTVVAILRTLENPAMVARLCQRGDDVRGVSGLLATALHGQVQQFWPEVNTSTSPNHQLNGVGMVLNLRF